jgi:hypothetical protein
MAKAKTTDTTPEEVVVDTPVTVEEVAPEKEAPGHGSRDFNSSL